MVILFRCPRLSCVKEMLCLNFNCIERNLNIAITYSINSPKSSNGIKHIIILNFISIKL